MRGGNAREEVCTRKRSVDAAPVMLYLEKTTLCRGREIYQIEMRCQSWGKSVISVIYEIPSVLAGRVGLLLLSLHLT